MESNRPRDEESPLLHHDIQPEVSNSSLWSLKAKLTAALTTSLLIAATTVSTVSTNGTALQEFTSSTSSSWTLKVNRLGYDEIPEHTRNTVYEIDYIVEPDATMVLHVSDCDDCDDLTWSIEPKSDRGSVTFDSTVTSNTMTAVFTDANAIFSVSVSQNDIELFNYELTCKYVRRELRTLNDKDLDRYFKALQVMYSTSQDEGLATYGPNFISYSHLTALHAKERVAYHGNLYFITSHPAMQIRFEKSLLSIDKLAPLNYWDFMKDYSLGRNWADSEIYSDKMFGAVRTKAEDNYQPTGYFHDVEYVYDPNGVEFPDCTTNPHGFLGSPFMTSSSKYLQRSNSYCGFESKQGQVSGDNLVTCFSKFKSAHNFRQFDVCLEETVHANLHMMHAGQWNCAVSWSDFYNENSDWADEMFLSLIAVSMSTETQTYQSFGYVSCPTSCSFSGDGDNSDCKCTSAVSDVTTADDVDALTKTQRFIYAQTAWSSIGTKSVNAQDFLVFKKEYEMDGTIFNNVWVPGVGEDNQISSTTGTAIDNDKLDALNTLVLKTVLFQGDYGITMSGAAANDPIFWVMHPVFDKVMHALRKSSIYNSEGFDWNNIKGDIKFNEMTGFTKVDFEPFAEPSTLAKLNSVDEEYLSNSDLWDLLDPSNNAIGYVYDQFTEWGNVAFDPFES